MPALHSLMFNTLQAISCWQTCTHTSYTISMVPAPELLPSPGGKIHMIHLVMVLPSFSSITGWLASTLSGMLENTSVKVYEVRFFIYLNLYPPRLAYLVDVAEMLVWQAGQSICILRSLTSHFTLLGSLL